ncbi:hypothetical protein GE061_006019 [Apolygus lucorum]|uniref:V-type proton ATPase subunit n=1 Tax=Apolygus lucorum TaxID=248454 RepID=A0A6A4J3Q9_APOLU|nr:hypothetical protein GE061_006019 [Apolygus lucorum]
MGYSLAVVGGISGFWAFVGLIVPFFIPKGPNKGVTQWCLILTASCSWMFWALTYMTQMNPLNGPKLSKEQVWTMAREWGYPIANS